jgi:two-component sensor histidine kinase
MEAVASLTSGIAHDFSNLITVLVGNLYLISEGVRDRPPLYEKSKQTRDAAKRSADLIKQLLSFARNEWAPSASADLHKVVANLEPLLRRAIGSRVSLETRIAEDVSAVGTTAAQLESAIVNLVINARDAIEGRGKIEVRVANCRIGEREAADYDVQPGDYVRTSVIDDGTGIPQHLLGRVFEPFFSTKGPGKGTGLGLAMVRLFAIQAGGNALLESEPGKGTQVSILLPRSIEGTSATTINTMPLSALPVGNETVLVFSEEAEVRGTVEQILATLGYKVVLSGECEEAQMRMSLMRVDLAIVDVTATHNSAGLRLLQILAKREHPTRIVALRDSTPVHHSGITTLQKPFDLASLATTVRNVLDGVRR